MTKSQKQIVSWALSPSLAVLFTVLVFGYSPQSPRDMSCLEGLVVFLLRAAALFWLVWSFIALPIHIVHDRKATRILNSKEGPGSREEWSILFPGACRCGCLDYLVRLESRTPPSHDMGSHRWYMEVTECEACRQARSEVEVKNPDSHWLYLYPSVFQFRVSSPYLNEETAKIHEWTKNPRWDLINERFKRRLAEVHDKNTIRIAESPGKGNQKSSSD